MTHKVKVKSATLTIDDIVGYILEDGSYLTYSISKNCFLLNEKCKSVRSIRKLLDNTKDELIKMETELATEMLSRSLEYEVGINYITEDKDIDFDLELYIYRDHFKLVKTAKTNPKDFEFDEVVLSLARLIYDGERAYIEPDYEEVAKYFYGLFSYSLAAKKDDVLIFTKEVHDIDEELLYEAAIHQESPVLDFVPVEYELYEQLSSVQLTFDAFLDGLMHTLPFIPDYVILPNGESVRTIELLTCSNSKYEVLIKEIFPGYIEAVKTCLDYECKKIAKFEEAMSFVHSCLKALYKELGVYIEDHRFHYRLNGTIITHDDNRFYIDDREATPCEVKELLKDFDERSLLLKEELVAEETGEHPYSLAKELYECKKEKI